MMARKVLPFLHYMIAALICALGLLSLVLWPASHWFEVRTMYIGDAKQGSPVLMLVDRTVSEPFTGRFNSSIHVWDGTAMVAYCTTPVSDPWEYKAMAKYPAPLTLEWWTSGKCHPLEGGKKYQVTTRWYLSNLRLFGLPIFPDKSVIAVSNIFEVKP